MNPLLTTALGGLLYGLFGAAWVLWIERTFTPEARFPIHQTLGAIVLWPIAVPLALVLVIVADCVRKETP